MIQQLVIQLVELLRLALVGVIPDPATRILAGPLPAAPPPSFPSMVLLPGKITFNQKGAEPPPKGPRPQDITQTLVPNPGALQGPYLLNQTPLSGSIQAFVHYPPGRRRALLVANKDFTIQFDLPGIHFTYDLTGASSIEVRYQFPAVFTLREFEQTLQIRVYGDTLLEAETIASLSLSAILTQHEAILTRYNETNPTLYQASAGYLSRHTLHTMTLLEGEALPEETQPQVHLALQVRGLMRLVQENPPAFGYIEQVRSAGVVTTDPIDIRPDLE